MRSEAHGHPRGDRDHSGSVPIRLNPCGRDGARSGEENNQIPHQLHAHRQRTGQEVPRRTSTCTVHQLESRSCSEVSHGALRSYLPRCGQPAPGEEAVGAQRRQRDEREDQRTRGADGRGFRDQGGEGVQSPANSRIQSIDTIRGLCMNKEEIG